MKTNTKTILSVVCTAAESVAIYYATVHGVIGARNIIYAIAIMNALVCVTSADKIAKKTNEKDERPYWMRACFTVGDIAQLVWLIWFGWAWCALAYGMGAVAGIGLRFDGVNKKQEPEKPA